MPESPGFSDTGFARISEVDTEDTGIGSGVGEAALTYRPEQDDLFVRLRFDRLEVAQLGIVHGLRFTFDGRDYAVRAAPGVPEADLGLFRCADDGSACREVATLEGGYGTTGHQIVVSVPLRFLHAGDSGRIQHLNAFSGVGTYESGVRRLHLTSGN